jgi:hypothetical protein
MLKFADAAPGQGDCDIEISAHEGFYCSLSLSSCRLNLGEALKAIVWFHALSLDILWAPPSEE